MQNAKTYGVAELEKVVIRRGNGQLIELGKPNTLIFKWRLLKYRFKLLWEKYRG